MILAQQRRVPIGELTHQARQSCLVGDIADRKRRSGWFELLPTVALERFSVRSHRRNSSPSPFPLPVSGERVEKGWRGAAEPYPELGEGVFDRVGKLL
jgi:hypothetical protein